MESYYNASADTLTPDADSLCDAMWSAAEVSGRVILTDDGACQVAAANSLSYHEPKQSRLCTYGTTLRASCFRFSNALALPALIGVSTCSCRLVLGHPAGGLQDWTLWLAFE